MSLNLVCSVPQLNLTRQTIAFELEDIHNGMNSEPLLVELIHQAAYRGNTLGLPGICPEENLGKISVEELKQFLASYYSPSRMVLAAVNVDHDQLVELTRRYFVDVETSWKEVEHRGIDQSVSQYSPGEVQVFAWLIIPGWVWLTAVLPCSWSAMDLLSSDPTPCLS